MAHGVPKGHPSRTRSADAPAGERLPPSSVPNRTSAAKPPLRASAPPSTSFDDAEAFSALASGVRLDILKSLSGRSKTIPELSRELDLHRLTLRHHLALLLREGLVEQVSPRHEGKAGRPPVAYKISPRTHMAGYPPRHFEIVAEAALTSLTDALGESAAREQLRRRGKVMGKAMIDGVAAQQQLTEWTPAKFEELVLGGLFQGFGIPNEVLSSSTDQIHYRSFGCPFLEIAEKMPTSVCDGLDEGFHDGVDEALGGVHTTRLACMGHGEAYCEYAMDWAKGKATKKAAKEHGAPKTSDGA
ncbi:MAG: helix-turn-helix domain-containing protein [Candidatus Thermoplasmatota archaeon]